MKIRTKSLALMLGAALSLSTIGAAVAEPASVVAAPAPVVAAPKMLTTSPTMGAKLVVKSGSVKVLLFADSTVEADGLSYTFTGENRHEIEVRSQASIITSKSINVEFNNAVGTYSDYRVERTVDFEGKGGIAQSDFDRVVRLYDAQFNAKYWDSISAHNDAVVTTTDVRDVLAFENAQVTVNHCWVATGFSKVAIKANGCRFLVDNVVAVPAEPAKN
jgi:hypothetical protein